MTLLRLAPKILERVLAMPPEAFSERELRRVAMLEGTEEQAALFGTIAGPRPVEPAQSPHQLRDEPTAPPAS